MCLKNDLKYICILFLLFGCTSIVQDPAQKYNEEFLKKNHLKIRSQKNKHLKIAKDNNIYYRDSKTDLVDSKYYNSTRGTKLKKEYKNKNEMYLEDNDKKEEVKYLDSDLSIYYRNRRLKDKDLTDSCDYNCDDNVAYLEENYKDYSKDRINFDDIVVTNKQLYGSLTLRKEKDYNYVDNATMQRNFDYIDVMNRVKREIYLKEKEEQEAAAPSGVVNDIKNRFRRLFGK